MKKILIKPSSQLHPPLIPTKIIPDPYRYKNLFLLLLVCLCNSIPLQAFTGISFIISDIYKESTLIVSINWISYFILYMVMVLPANYVIEEKGLKTATVISETCMILGLSLRCLINVSIAYFLFGTLLCSFGFCLTISAANKLPSMWFLNKEIFPVKSLLIFALLCSDALGYGLSKIFITKQSTKSDVFRFFLIESIIIAVFQIANIIFFRGKPQSPQKQHFLSQSYFSRKSFRSFQRNIRHLVSNTSYLMLFLVMTFVFIDLSVLFLGLTQFQRAYSMVEGRMGIRMLLVFLSGFFGCCLNAFYYPNQYKWKSVVFLMVTSLSHCILWLGYETRQQWLIDISSIGIGVSILPLITTIVDWSSQCAFPVGEGTSGGSLFFGGYTFGSISTLLFGIYIGHNDAVSRSRITILMFLAFLMLSFLFVMLAEENLKRKQFEEYQVIEQKIGMIDTDETVGNEVIV